MFREFHGYLVFEPPIERHIVGGAEAYGDYHRAQLLMNARIRERRPRTHGFTFPALRNQDNPPSTVRILTCADIRNAA